MLLAWLHGRQPQLSVRDLVSTESSQKLQSGWVLPKFGKIWTVVSGKRYIIFWSCLNCSSNLKYGDYIVLVLHYWSFVPSCETCWNDDKASWILSQFKRWFVQVKKVSVYHTAAEVSDFGNPYLERRHTRSWRKWRLNNDLWPRRLTLFAELQLSPCSCLEWFSPLWIHFPWFWRNQRN